MSLTLKELREMKQQLTGVSIVPYDGFFVAYADARVIPQWFWQAGRRWYAIKLWLELITDCKSEAEDILISAPWRQP